MSVEAEDIFETADTFGDLDLSTITKLQNKYIIKITKGLLSNQLLTNLIIQAQKIVCLV